MDAEIDARSASSPPVSVVFLSDWGRFPHGMAASNRVRLLARACVDAGAHAHVVCMQAADRPDAVENTRTRGAWHGVTFEYTAGTTVRSPDFLVRRSVEARGWLAGAFRLVQLRRAGRMDCVYLWFTSQSLQAHRLVFITLLHALGVRVIMELNERPWSLRRDRRLVERRASPLLGMDGAVSISRYLTRWVDQEAARLGRRLPVIEVPILLDTDEESGLVELPSGDPVVVFAGAPVYDRTVDFILDAMEHVWGRFPDCSLVITGSRLDDPATHALRARLRDRAAGGDRVRLAGYLPRRELLCLYAASAALLIPLFDDVESQARFPTKIAEYMASGRPVVSTRVGEVARLLTDGENALLSLDTTAEAYADSICLALSDEDAAARIGAAGRDFARSHFDYRAHAHRLAAFFAQVSRASRRRLTEPGRGADG
jgi:glycosyltransferase involved in cell wall biosynthesis